MYYVAKLYNHNNPSIIMDFKEEEHAKQYAELMTKAGKGTYIVLMPVPKYEILEITKREEELYKEFCKVNHP